MVLGKLQPYILAFSMLFGVGSCLGLGFLWNRVNEPAPIIFECQKEVLDYLKGENIPPIVEPRKSKKEVLEKAMKTDKK